MFDLTGFGRRVRFGLKTPQCAAIAFAALTAGCSADVTRFDSASFNLNDSSESADRAPVPREPVYAQSDYNNPVSRSTPRGPYGAGASDVEVASLPDGPSAPAPQGRSGGYTEQSWRQSPRGTAAPAPNYRAAAAQPYRPAPSAGGAPTGSGRTIVVQPGDTLYRLSRTHGVALSELMQANGLSSPDLKPGQRLVLPGGGAPSSYAAPVAAAAPEMRAPSRAMPVTPDAAARFNGTYTVQPGDSLYQIARSHNVNYAELQTVNGIADPRRVMPGTVLRVPAGTNVAAIVPPPSQSMSDAPASFAPPPISEPAARPSYAAPSAASYAAPTAPTYNAPAVRSVRPSVINAREEASAPSAMVPPVATQPKIEQVAVAAPQASAPVASTGNVQLRWPVIGRVVAGFGGRPDGTHNDGINLSVPLGTDVHAAETGVVAYAGSELKGYGNLILVRHDNGWVTAYAHNEELLVKRGDKVSRGQVIAKAGKTGTVDQPQLHFELRQGSRPVDPTPYMERL